jgi:bacterioferritin
MRPPGHQEARMATSDNGDRTLTLTFVFALAASVFGLLAALFKRTAVEEMMHGERLAECIMFLEGEVEMQASAEVRRIHDVKVMLKIARQMETGSVHYCNAWANECSQVADSVSKKGLAVLVADQERHYDQHLALQSIERSKAAATAAPERT